MFEGVLDQLKQQVAGVLMSEHGLDQSAAERTAEAAGKTLVDTVKQQINRNDFSTVNEALSGSPTDASHPALQSLVAPLSAGLAERTGMDAAKATGIASTLLPFVFNMFNEQVQQAKANGTDVPALVKQLATGGLSMANMGVAMSLAKTFMKDKAGKTGIGGLFSKLF